MVTLGDTPASNTNFADVTSFANFNSTFDSITTLGTKVITQAYPGLKILKKAFIFK